MIIFGAGGFSKEVLQVLKKNSYSKKILFFDDINKHSFKLFNKYEVLNNEEQVIFFFKNINSSFCVGIGNPYLRYKAYKKFKSLGGDFKTIISANSNYGEYDVSIDKGVIILPGVNISNSVNIGKGTVIYYNSIITHDCNIGDFVEIAPSVNILGRAKIGSFSKLGANCTILPDIIIGKGVTIGAGSVITKDVPDNKIVVGVPGRILD